MAALLDLWTGLTGTVLPFAGATAPSGWLMCHGQEVSRTTYRALFDVIGTHYGPGNGTTTFNLPDIRGEFIRGSDNGRGIDSGRVLGSRQGHSIQRHDHYLPTSTSDLTSDFYNIPDNLWQKGGVNSQPVPGTTAQTIVSGPQGNFESETRPRNIALNHIIKF